LGNDYSKEEREEASEGGLTDEFAYSFPEDDNSEPCLTASFPIKIP
jgi:hypothetical protein